MNAISKAYLDAYDKIQDTVEKAIKESGQNVLIKYSAYEDANDIPINNLKKVPVKGKVIFYDEEQQFESKVYDSPTWLEIAVIANEMVNITDDYRTFIEMLDVYNDGGMRLIATREALKYILSYIGFSEPEVMLNYKQGKWEIWKVTKK